MGVDIDGYVDASGHELERDSKIYSINDCRLNVRTVKQIQRYYGGTRLQASSLIYRLSELLGMIMRTGPTFQFLQTSVRFEPRTRPGRSYSRILESV
jgi:hypothetical protein